MSDLQDATNLTVAAVVRKIGNKRTKKRIYLE